MATKKRKPEPADWYVTTNDRRASKMRTLTLDDVTWAMLTEMAGDRERSRLVAALIAAEYAARKKDSKGA